MLPRGTPRTAARPKSISSDSNRGIVSGVGITNSRCRRSPGPGLRYSSACGQAGFHSMTVFLLISARCTSLSRGTKWIICVPSCSRKLFDHLPLVIDLAAVADQAAEAHAARFGEFHNALADVVGGIHGHHLAGTDDVDLLGLAFADRHGESAAHDVAQHIVENVVEVHGCRRRRRAVPAD